MSERQFVPHPMKGTPRQGPFPPAELAARALAAPPPQRGEEAQRHAEEAGGGEEAQAAGEGESVARGWVRQGDSLGALDGKQPAHKLDLTSVGQEIVMRTVLLLAALAAFFPPPVCARAASGRLPWTMTVEERLARRFDPADIVERRQAYEARQNAKNPTLSSTANGTTKENLVYVIDGRRDPELFLPHELFDWLVSGLTPDVSMRAKQREFYGSALRAFGFDEDDFWNRLAIATGEYVRIKYGLGVSADVRCRSRHDALSSAREAFGQDRFDQVLYTVVAPTAQYSSATTELAPADDLRRIAGGCK